MGEVAFLFLVPLAMSVGFGFVTRALAKRRHGWVAFGIVIASIMGGLLCYWQSLQPSYGPSDYSGLVWAILTFVVAVPSAVGALIGLVIGIFAPEQV